MMKKLMLFLALSLLFSCTVIAEETVTITFWHSMSDTAGDVINACVDNFNETVGAEKGIRVEAIYQGSYNDAVQKMNSMIFARNLKDLPDVMQLDATGKVHADEYDQKRSGFQ